MGTVTSSLIQKMGTATNNLIQNHVSYSSHYFGPGCWLLFILFWMMFLVNVPIILVQAVT
jgi:hypothetical protein